MEPKLFRWQLGRQGSYFKFPLIYSKKLKLDAYILKFPEGSFLPRHMDEIGNNIKHYRLNIILKKPKSGGEFIYEGKPIININRIKLFDAGVEHELSKIINGSRLVLSFGIGIKE